jgi:hypothetical protein
MAITVASFVCLHGDNGCRPVLESFQNDRSIDSFVPDKLNKAQLKYFEFRCHLNPVLSGCYISVDVLGKILKKVTAKRSRARMVDKLLSMGLVSDRRELHKKRRRNPNAPGKSAAMGMVT